MNEPQTQLGLFSPPKTQPSSFGPNFERTFDRPLSHRNDPLSSYRAGDKALLGRASQGAPSGENDDR
jgi:hypothetical protein